MVQWLIVGVVVAVSAFYMLGRVFPRWRAAFALHLQQARYPQWIRRLGARLDRGGAAGCGGGACNSCGSCAPTSKKSADPARH